MKILIIEDEPDLLQNMVQSLKKEHYTVETADSYASGMDKIIDYDYTCILLDIGLPGGSGLQILEELRNMKKTDSVIIISAKDSLDDKLTGLDKGADDYLTKPFHLAELNARIKAVLRRKSFDGQNDVSAANVRIQLSERSVTVNEKPVALNRKEYDLLMYFMENRSRLISKTSIAEHVWGDHADESDDLEFVYSQIKNLRKKLKDAEAGLEIQAVYGVGYKLVVS